MPLWDNFARQAEALPVASPHGNDDFAAIYDVSLGASARTALRNLRSRELLTVPMYISVIASPPVSGLTTPLRVIRAPYAFTVTSVVLHATTPPGATIGMDVHAGGISIFTGSGILANNITLDTTPPTNTRREINSFSGVNDPSIAIAATTELRFFVVSTNTNLNMPHITLMGYRT